MKMAPTKVVHWKKEPCDIYIGRPGPWGNPFSIGPDGDRAEVSEIFRYYRADRQEHFASLRTELKGKVLGCWCAPKPCHGDVLAEIADREPTPESP